VRRNGVYNYVSTNKARSSLLKPVDAARSLAEIAVAQMGVRCRAFLRLLNIREKLVCRCIVIEEERRSQVGSEADLLQTVWLNPACACVPDA
jgi:hypothetical protein